MPPQGGESEEEEELKSTENTCPHCLLALPFPFARSLSVSVFLFSRKSVRGKGKGQKRKRKKSRYKSWSAYVGARCCLIPRTIPSLPSIRLPSAVPHNLASSYPVHLLALTSPLLLAPCPPSSSPACVSLSLTPLIGTNGQTWWWYCWRGLGCGGWPGGAWRVQGGGSGLAGHQLFSHSLGVGDGPLLALVPGTGAHSPKWFLFLWAFALVWNLGVVGGQVWPGEGAEYRRKLVVGAGTMCRPPLLGEAP